MKNLVDEQHSIEILVKDTFDQETSALFIFITFSFILAGVYFYHETAGLYSYTLLGVLITGYNLYVIYKINKRTSWKPIHADVEKIEIIEHHIPNDSPTIRFYPQIEYTYQVDGTQHTSNLYVQEVKYHWFNHLAEATEYINTQINNHQIKVYYNPIKPSEAMMIHGVTIDEVGVPFLGVLFGLAISTLALYFLMYF